MALPDHALSSTPVLGGYLYPDNLILGVLTDYEFGGIALSDSSEGLQYQVWAMTYDVVVGDVIITPEITLTPQTLFTEVGIKHLSFTFDQNMHPFVTYINASDEAWYWWYDPIAPGQVYTQLPAGSTTPRCTLDDKRESQISVSDVLLAYVLNGNLYYREERDRYTIEYLLKTGVPNIFKTIGMTSINRIQFDLGGHVTVGRIVRDLCSFLNVTNINTVAIDSIPVRGFVSAGTYTGADSIRTLQKTYMFDLPEIDGTLVAVLRGGDPVATIMRTDMVRGEEAKFEVIRSQSVEFPKKLHVSYANKESDYTPTKQTSERRSGDIRSISEMGVDLPINLVDAEASQVAHKMHKIAWAEQQGPVKFATSEEFAYLVPSDIIMVEAQTGALKRVRVQKHVYVDGMLQIESMSDRASSYESEAIAATPILPFVWGTNIIGATTYEMMDIPVLRQAEDTLHVYISAFGIPVWYGYNVEQLVGTDWISRGSYPDADTLGELKEELPSHAAGLDTVNTVLVSASYGLIAAITQSEFDAGGNRALIGDEIINFRDVVAEGSDFRISYLNRQAYNTPTATHPIASRFVILESPVALTLDAAYLGQTVTFRAYSTGIYTNALAVETAFTFVGNSQREWAPLGATMELISADWTLNWKHNKRIGFPGVAIISQHFLDFSVELVSGGTTIVLTTSNETLIYTEAEQIADFGAAVVAWTSITVWGNNRYTGAGDIATLVDITGNRLLLSGGGGSLLLSGGGGALLLSS